MTWLEVNLSEVADVQWGNTSITKASYVDKGFPAFSATGNDGYVEQAEHNVDGIVLSAIGARCGKCFLASGKWTAIKNTITIVPNPSKIHLKYLYLILNDEKSWLTKGAAQPFITLGIARNRKIPLPPLAEQKRIAALLGTADNIIRLREQATAKLDELALSRFNELLTQKENITETKRLGEICDVRDGTHDSPKYVNDGFPLVTSKNLTNGFIDLTNVNLISQNDFDEINKRSKVDCGDILMPMIGTIGNPVIVKEKNPVFAIKNVALIKSLPNSPNPNYIKAVLESQQFEKYVAKISRGGTQKFLGLGDIRKFDIYVLDKKVENEFVSFVLKLNEVKESYLRSIFLNQQMISSLQHQSFAVN
jgi:type I restriction enzyme S subunit